MQKKNLKISIIVPVYNVAEYIVRCLDSIVCQTYSNLECIIVNDASTDNSLDLVRQYLNSYRGAIAFQLISLPENAGLSSARNRGTEMAQGDYLFYLDSDDELLPSAISDLVLLAEKYPGVEIVQGNMRTLPEPDLKTDIPCIAGKDFPEYSSDPEWINRRYYQHRYPIPVNACNKLIKRSFIFDNQLFFKAGMIYEDALWLFFVLKHLQTIAFCERDSYIRYVRTGSIMQSTDTYLRFHSWLVLLQEVFNHLDKTYSKLQKKKYYRRLFWQMTQIDLHSKDAEFYPAYRNLVKSVMKKEIFHQSLLLTLALCILLIPQRLCKSLIISKIFGLYLKLS